MILKIYAWQNTAAPWFWLFVISAGYLATSYFFFQRCLFMSPTQTSALVRLGFAVAGVGALIGLLLPFGFIARLVAYVLGFAGAIYGYLQSSVPHPAADTANCLAAPAFPFAAPQAARALRPFPRAPRLAMCRAFSADFMERGSIWCRALNLQTRRSARR